MHNKIISIFFLFLIVQGCKKETTLSFSSESITEKSLDLCSTDTCPEITINSLEYLDGNLISEALNKSIESFITASLNIGEEETSSSKSVLDAMNQFVIAYQEDKALYADMSAEYMAEVNVQESFRSKNLICLEMRQYKFTGGAHGFGSVRFENFDIESGKMLAIEHLVPNESEFLKFAEKHFRKKFNIAENESINAPGFWFENDSFYLPESFGFSEDQLIFIYNQYDIASYAEGPIEIQIPIKEAKDYLNYSLKQ